MKIKPEIFLNTVTEIQYKKILITGTDESFMGLVKNHIIDIFKKKNYLIDISGTYKGGLVGDLFSENKILFVLSAFSEESKAGEIDEGDAHSLLVISPSSSKTKKINNLFSTLKDALVVECYPLNTKAKELVLKYFVEKSGIKLSNEVYWYIVENLDNNYAVFINQLESLELYNKKIDDVERVEKIAFVENKVDLNRIFFGVFKSNNNLIKSFNKNILSQSDLYVFLNSIKSYLEIIKDSKNISEAEKKFPKYLFREKDSFLKIYKRLEVEKILKIYSNISKLEALARKHPGLYLTLGLRFFLNTKKIITS